MIFFDRSLPKSVALALKHVRTDVIHLEDRFRQKTPDDEWLRFVGESGHLALTRGLHIQTRPGERRAIVEHAVGCFCIVQRRPLTSWQCLKLIAINLDEMQRLFEETPRPFLYLVSTSAGIRRFALGDSAGRTSN